MELRRLLSSANTNDYLIRYYIRYSESSGIELQRLLLIPVC